jgi:CheY-like chemotaxis protein
MVALTLMGAAEAEEAYHSAGIDDFIAKPLTKDKLAKIAARLKAK